jgi:hypothetical protein
MRVIVRWPGAHPASCIEKWRRGVRFGNTTVPETMGRDLIQSFRSQPFTEESEVGEEPVKPDRTR